MSINQLHTEIDALTVAAPNFAAVRMIAGLRGISFHEAMIAQAQEWATALDEAIARETAEAAMYIRQGESTTHPNQRAAAQRSHQTPGRSRPTVERARTCA